MALTRLQMEDIIAAGGTVLWRGERITNPADLPTQDELDYYALTVPADNSGIIDAVNAVEDDLEARLPAALDADGGLKVHVQNSSGGSSGLTDTQLRATPVPVSGTVAVSNPQSSVSVSNFPATQPVSGTVAVSNLPATQPVSAASLPLPTGASTAANQTTQNTSLASIDAKLPAALGSGSGLKVDLVGNTAGVGGLSMGSIVTLQSNASVTPNTEVLSSEISAGSYRGIRIRLQRTSATATSFVCRVYPKMPDGTYEGSARWQSGDLGSGNTGMIEVVIHPEIAVELTTTTKNKWSNFLPSAFKIAIFAGSAVAQTVYLDYQLLP